MGKSKSKGCLLITNDLLAAGYLEHISLIKGPLRYWRRTFYYWVKTHYKNISDDEINVYLSKYLDDFFGALKDSGKPYKTDGNLKFQIILAKVRNASHIPEETESEIMLSGEKQYGFLSTPNGIVSLSDLPTSGAVTLLPHTQDFWTHRALANLIDLEKDCPIFKSFLRGILPDEADQKLVQEIFGYSLLPDNRFQKAFIFVGDGSNGKSVLLLILRLILGHENVASLSLDAIDPARTFTLALMVNKLVNISEDMNEIEKVAEGTFKMMVAGETIVVERKHKDPFPWKVTTKLIFSTNNLPRFSDKTEGVMRRLVILPFLKKIDEKERRLEFTDPQFWIDTRELPAILGWALQGLQRLLLLKQFTTSPNADSAKLNYRKETNPVSQFFDDYVETLKEAELASGELYTAYNGWAKSNGYHALAASTFTKEVKRRFPTATLGGSARAYQGTRTRFWTGLKLLPSWDELPTPAEVGAQKEDEFPIG